MATGSARDFKKSVVNKFYHWRLSSAVNTSWVAQTQSMK